MTRLETLCKTRDHLMKELAPTLKRAGPNHPDRSKVNAERTAKRKQIRRQLRKNADEIAALVMHATLTHRGT